MTTNPELLKQLLNARLLQGVQQSLLTNYEDPETVKSIIDIIKQIVNADSKLAQGFIQAIRYGYMCFV